MKCSGLSPKSYFVAVCIGHMGVFYATTIGLWASVTTPRQLTYRVSGRQLVEPSTRGMPWGLALHNRKVPAVPKVLYGCVVAQENPHVPLLFPSLSLLSCYLPDFNGEFLEKVLMK